MIFEQQKKTGVKERIFDKYRITKCFSSRRGKGQTLLGILRTDSSRDFLIRKLNTAVMNSNVDDGVLKSLLSEASIIQQLDHPNIQKLEEVQIAKKEDDLEQFTHWMYLVYPYQKYNLMNYLKSEKQPGQLRSMVKDLFFQILSGLEYMHSKGIIHRNLKPENVLVSASGRVQISDFFGSRLASIPNSSYTPEIPKDRVSSSREEKRMWYKAHEVFFRPQFYSYETDVWSAGCLFAEMVTGRSLFHGNSEVKLLTKVYTLLGNPS